MSFTINCSNCETQVVSSVYDLFWEKGFHKFHFDMPFYKERIGLMGSWAIKWGHIRVAAT